MLTFEKGQVCVLNETVLALVLCASESNVSFAMRDVVTGMQRIRQYRVDHDDPSRIQVIGRIDTDGCFIKYVHRWVKNGAVTCRKCSEFYPYAEADQSVPFTCYACKR